MATATRGTVTLHLDERSIRSFNRKVDAVIRAEGTYAKATLKDFCEDVLLESTRLVPIDTGTLARSAGYKIQGNAKEGYTARVGYGIDRNLVNPRTGKRASSYASSVHEAYHFKPFPKYGRTNPNGEGKFLEKALYACTEDFFKKNKESLQKSLQAKQGYVEYTNEDTKFTQKLEVATVGRKSIGFTAKNKGKILPFPLDGGTAPTGRKNIGKINGKEYTAGKARASVIKRYKRKSTYEEQSRASHKKSQKTQAKQRAYKKHQTHRQDAFDWDNARKRGRFMDNFAAGWDGVDFVRPQVEYEWAQEDREEEKKKGTFR